MNTFRDAMRTRDFVLSCTLPMPANIDGDSVRRRADELAEQADALQLEEDRIAAGAIDPLATAGLLRASGHDAVVHISARDRNRLALRGALLGAAMLGLSSVVLSRGSKLPDSLRGKVKGVFDMSAADLLQMTALLNEASSDSHGLYAGSRVSVIRADESWTATRVIERLDAGAAFLQTMPCLNGSMLRDWMARMVTLRLTHRAAIVVDVPLLAGAAEIKLFKTHYRGARIPGAVAERLASASDPADEAIKIVCEFVAELREIPGVSGANIVARKNSAALAECLQRIRQ